MSSTRKNSFAIAAPKITKIGPNDYDDMSVWKAINSSSQTKIDTFDELKANARNWIGNLERCIECVGGSIETHALGILPLALEGSAAKWYLKFIIENADPTWELCKQKFITSFTDSFATNLRLVTERKKTTETFAAYGKARMELCSKLFPDISQANLNSLVMSGLDEINIKRIFRQKNSSKDTFLLLMGALDELNASNDA